jgi:hypothetical protein
LIDVLSKTKASEEMSSKSAGGDHRRNGKNNVLAGNFCYYPAAIENIAALVAEEQEQASCRR